MMISELFLLVAIFSLCVFLAYEDLRSAFVFLLLVSPLLHKEVFSLVRWDVLPIRLVVLAILFTCAFKFLVWVRKKREFESIISFVKDPMLVVLVTLWLVRLVSLINSKNIQASLLIFSFYSTMVFLYILTSFLAKKYKDSFIFGTMKFYAFIAFGTAIVAAIQLFVERKFGIAFGAIWRIPNKLPRLGSVFWDVNHYAGFISSIIPISFAMMLLSKTKMSKVLYGFMTLSMIVILVMTNSRSAWIGFFVSTVLLSAYIFKLKFGLKKLLMMCAVLLLPLIPLSVEYQNKDSALREKIRSYFHYRGDSYASHFLLLEGAYAVFEKHPFIGGGYGSFYEHFKESYVATTYYARDPAALSVRVPAHSIWGEVLAETGAAGFFVFIVFSFLLLGTIFYSATKQQELAKKIFSAALGFSVLSYLISGVFYSYNAEFFWIVLFLGFVYSKSLLGPEYSSSKIYNFIFSRNTAPILLILIASAIFIFLNLGRNHLIPWDEAIYSKVSKNMVTTGDYITPQWELGKNWFEKPPLFMWAQSFLMGFLGYGSWSAKLPSALAGLGSLILVYLLGTKMFNRQVGLMASFILLTTSQFLFYSRMAMLDVATSFFILLAVFFYFHYLNSKQIKFAILSGVAGGMAVMTKGVVGLLIIPMLGVSELYLFKLSPQNFLRFRFSAYKYFALGFLIVSLPWHLYMILRYGEDFTDTYFGYHAFKRATQSVEGKGESIYWYLIVLRTSMRIWFAALLGSLGVYLSFIFLKFKGRAFKVLEFTQNHHLLLLWSLVLFVFFSVSVSKLVWYIIPIYPYLSLFVASVLLIVFERFSAKFNFDRADWAKGLFTLFICFVGCFYIFLVRDKVYVGDSTGDAAKLTMLKEETFGITDPLYYDRIEKPVVLFYSNGPLISIDFKPLLSKIEDVDFDETLIFLTKNGRFEQIEGMHPVITDVVKTEGDFTLARVKSRKEFLEQQIAMAEEKIKWVLEESTKGDPKAVEELKYLPVFKTQLADLREMYQAGLSQMDLE